MDRNGSLVVLENTGGYEKKCIEVLSKIGFAIHKTENKSFKSRKEKRKRPLL